MNEEHPMNEKPTADQLADAMTDVALGGMLFQGDQRDEYLLGFAKLIRARLRRDDKRLSVLAAHTDATGYVWFPEGSFAWRDEAHRARWSYERRLTAFFDAIAAAPARPAEELEAARAEAEQLEHMAKSGFRAVHAGYDADTREGGIVFVRDDVEG